MEGAAPSGSLDMKRTDNGEKLEYHASGKMFYIFWTIIRYYFPTL